MNPPISLRAAINRNIWSGLTAAIVAGLCVSSMMACTAPPPRSTATTSSGSEDGAITAQVRAELEKEPLTKAASIRVETADGVVKLSGFVDTLKERNKALELARSVKGVKQVKDSLEVKQPADG